MRSLQVADFMNTRPVSLRKHMTVAYAVELLLQRNQLGAPVLDQAGKVVGFLSQQDCLRMMLECGYYREQAAHVADIMRTDVLSLRPYDCVMDVAQQMLLPKPKIYPVVDDEGVLLGCLSRMDVLKALDAHMLDGYRQAG